MVIIWLQGNRYKYNSYPFTFACRCKGFDTTGGGEVKLWDLRTNKVVSEYTRHSFDVVACAFHGDCCMSASKDGTLGVWRYNANEGLLMNVPDANLLTSLSILENDKNDIILGVSSFDGSLSIERLIAENGSFADLKHMSVTPASN